MGILDSLTRNPGLLGLAALGIGLFIFRDRISGFFSDITGGAAGTAQIAETGGILAKNLTSNLTLTPLPDDPIFGESGLFAGIGKFFSDFKLPSFPSFPEVPGIVGRPFDPDPRDFTDVGMAASRARQTESIDLPLGELPGFEAAKALADAGLVTRELREIPFAVENVPETQAGFQARSMAFGEALPDVTFQTSFIDGDIVFGRQLSRESQDFENVLAAEARRSESIFAGLFGNVQNPDF